MTRSGSIHRERLHSSDQEVVLRAKKKRKTKLQRQSTLIRTEVDSLPSFWPWFIVLVSVAQVNPCHMCHMCHMCMCVCTLYVCSLLQLAVVIVLLPIYGLAPIRLTPTEQNDSFASLMTDNDSNVTYYRSNNIWIGLTPLDLVRFGGKFSPCMRKDFGIINTVNTALTAITSSSEYGCCQNRENVGNTLRVDCIVAGNESSEMFFEQTIRCSSNSSTTNGANFHPCCISITGQCEIMDLDQCNSRGGFYHDETDSCDNVRLRHMLTFADVLLAVVCRSTVSGTSVGLMGHWLDRTLWRPQENLIH